MARWKLPPQQDFKFYQRRKHDKWREVDPPTPSLEACIADSHSHVHSLPDPAWELARCAANGVDLVCDVADPTDDAMERVFDLTDSAMAQQVQGYLAASANESAMQGVTPPQVVLTLGVHPHNADDYDDEVEQRLEEYLRRLDVAVLGEIGLDYYYDNSEREAQREVFRRQIRLAKRLGIPIALHLRSGDGPDADAHGEAYDILVEEGFPEAGTLLHCCALPAEQLQPWVDAGCYVAYGGALTFKDADEAREGARIVPSDRLLLETDAPYMTPEPMRGATCTPSHVIFTAERLAEVRDAAPGAAREELLRQTRENTERFFKGGTVLAAME